MCGIANTGLNDNMLTCLRVHSSFSSLVQSLLPKDTVLRTYSIDLILPQVFFYIIVPLFMLVSARNYEQQYCSSRYRCAV